MRVVKTVRTLGLGGGCHWCTEAVFEHLRGVRSVEQGFHRSDLPNGAWSEAVRVSWDPSVLPFRVLLEVHLRTHASTSAHSLRGKYRSAVYVGSESGAGEVRDALAELQGGFAEPLVTQVLPDRGFRMSEARFQNYYRTDPERPFCRTYIDPKLAMLRREFGEVVR